MDPVHSRLSYYECCALHNMLLAYDYATNGENLERCERFWEDMISEAPAVKASTIQIELLDVWRAKNLGVSPCYSPIISFTSL